MRICLPTGIFPPDIGGPASFVPQIAGRLLERGHHVEVITLADHPEENLASYPFLVHRFRRGEMRFVRLVRTLFEIAAVAHRSDAIFANGLFVEAALAAWLARRPLTLKIVGDWAWERAVNWRLTRDDLEGFRARRQGLRAELLKLVRSSIVRQATLIIVPSQYLKQTVQGWGVKAERIVCIYNACEVAGVQTESSLPKFDGTTLCTIARLVPWKGVGSLIRLVRDLPQTRLVIVGEGPLQGSLERQANEMGVRSRVVFMGRQDPSEVGACLAASDLFVLNSSYEGLPHVILEAFAAGVPVLATGVGGVPEVVNHGQNGWLVPAGVDEALRQAVERLLADKALRRKLIEGGRKTLAEKFSWPRLITETEGALTKSLGTDRLADG